tara:strand:- start:252 stop:1301 length:1050 start_codon:yes stop_codon:yes gene_type:complete
MAWFKKINVDTTTAIPLSRFSTPSQISSYIKKLINASQYEYHESEALEVKEVIRNEVGDRDSIRGVFLNSGEDPGVVKSLLPNIVNVPVVGEHVVCVEYNGQHYYTSVINRKGSVNENSIPGVVGGYDKNKKYGKNFERKNVKQLKINEGSIIFEGRHGQSVHLDRASDHTPQILMRVHKTFEDGDDETFIREDIDKDDASIYLVSNGLSTINFDGGTVEGKKVLIQSDGIFIKGRGEQGEVRIKSDNSVNLDGVESVNLKSRVTGIESEETNINSNNVTIGNGKSQPLVLGNELKNILMDIASVLKQLPLAVNSAQLPLGSVDVTMSTKITALTGKINKMLSTNVKTT